MINNNYDVFHVSGHRKYLPPITMARGTLIKTIPNPTKPQISEKGNQRIIDEVIKESST